MIVGLGFFFFQAEDGIRDLVRSRGLGDVYKRQIVGALFFAPPIGLAHRAFHAACDAVSIHDHPAFGLSLIHI